jgi:hypothetical protein
MFSVGALIISVISLCVTVWLWQQSNRPVVTARIKTHSGGNIAIMYLLELVNSGSRPAKNIRLHVTQEQITSALTPEAKNQPGFADHLRTIERCFEERAIVQVLLNGEITANPFGYTSIERPFWRPGATMRLQISYHGLQGQRYTSRVTIRIDDTAGFAGALYATQARPGASTEKGR